MTHYNLWYNSVAVSFLLVFDMHNKRVKLRTQANSR